MSREANKLLKHLSVCAILFSICLFHGNVIAGTYTYKMGTERNGDWIYSSAVYSAGGGHYYCCAIYCSTIDGVWGKLKADGYDPYEDWDSAYSFNGSTWYYYMDSMTWAYSDGYTYYKAWEKGAYNNRTICDQSPWDDAYMKFIYTYDGDPWYTRYLHAC